jgi:hypothetical protein
VIRERFILKNESNHGVGYSPGDMIMFLVDGTLSGSAVTVDLSAQIRDGAVVHYFVFKPATLDSSGQFSAAAAVAGASDVALVMIIVDQKDLKYAGE